MRRIDQPPVFCLDPAPDDPVPAIEARMLERVEADRGAALAWRCTLVVPGPWLLGRREILLIKLGTALGQLYRDRRDNRTAALAPELVAVRFRILSCGDRPGRPWLRAPCYRVFDSARLRDLDPGFVDSMLDLDLAA